MGEGLYPAGQPLMLSPLLLSQDQGGRYRDLDGRGNHGDDEGVSQVCAKWYTHDLSLALLGKPGSPHYFILSKKGLEQENPWGTSSGRVQPQWGYNDNTWPLGNVAHHSTGWATPITEDSPSPLHTHFPGVQTPSNPSP